VTLRAEDGSTRVAELADLKADVEQAGALLVTAESTPPAAAPVAPAAPAPAGEGPERPRRRRRRGRGGPGAGA